jgi:predicted metal-dependent enzyme (double-stranded beta helix superfamily)
MVETFGTIRGDGDHDVVLRFTQAYAGIIREKNWHPGQVIEPQPDGTLLLRLHVNDLRLISAESCTQGPSARCWNRKS